METPEEDKELATIKATNCRLDWSIFKRILLSTIYLRFSASHFGSGINGWNYNVKVMGLELMAEIFYSLVFASKDPPMKLLA